MFAIAQKTDLYHTYLLSDQSADTHIEVVPERGGIVTQWRVRDQNILYLDTERFKDPKLSVRGGIPILFPICGNLPDNQYSFDGATYQLPQHGFGRTLPWTVSGQSTDGSASLSLKLTSNDQTRSVYPFEFEIEFTYTLNGDRLEIHQNYTNQSDKPMPFSAGFHPYFEAPDKASLEVGIPATEFQRNGETTMTPFAGQFDFSEPEIDVAFKSLTSQTSSVRDRSRNLKLTLESDELFSTLVFWTVQGKDFYCLEPWSAPRNALNTGEQLTTLEPGQTLKTAIALIISSQ